ncbi:MAG: site-specific DNA-methyltransferase [Dehalococcoidia bacterium]|nr:site-specific DNA-methyltransferase [Dehalococcoidia bacterium]MDW8119817.1 site-specific DNA-methyltransferase [Chloroflexota bacterium]
MGALTGQPAPNPAIPRQGRPQRVNRLAARLGCITTAAQARQRVRQWIAQHLPPDVTVALGLPEVDDRHKAWRVALLEPHNGLLVGEVMVRCADGEVMGATRPGVLLARLGYARAHPVPAPVITQRPLIQDPLPSQVVCGDARLVLPALPDGCVHLVLTSPPYYNARPQYGEFPDYPSYLSMLEEVFAQCHRVLAEGRFLIVNASPVLVRRPSRSRSSRRIPVPFHINAILERLGFDFLDDIIWVKPEGAGWNTGRGRRFAADRHPLQYKPVPVTEYFLVYRKQTERLIDWNIRTHPDREAVAASTIDDGYAVTNVWYARPAHHPHHPAVFPLEIVERLVRYYSFIGDVVLDPFAGVGTVGKACLKLGRRFILVDAEPAYCAVMRRELGMEASIPQEGIGDGLRPHTGPKG